MKIASSLIFLLTYLLLRKDHLHRMKSEFSSHYVMMRVRDANMCNVEKPPSLDLIALYMYFFLLNSSLKAHYTSMQNDDDDDVHDDRVI